MPEVDPGREALRVCIGHAAKQLGKELLRKYVYVNDIMPEQFRHKIKAALRLKAKTPSLHKMLLESTLPFDHYYAYGNKRVKPTEHWWVIEEWELIRKEIKGET